MRRFELSEGSSNKFWEIEIEKQTLTIRFGRIGTNGQTQIKKRASLAVAETEFEKLIREKLNKGYREVSSGDAKELRVKIAADPGSELPKLDGVLGAALRLFESMSKSGRPRSVTVGRVTFPAGNMKKWLAKKIRWHEETVAELIARAAALAEQGEHWLELTIDGDTLSIRGWDWLEDESLVDTLAQALEAAASLSPKGEMKRFARFSHGNTQWVSWKFAGKKLVIDESDDGDELDWDEDKRVKAALAEVTPRLDAWLSAHADTQVRIERSKSWGYVDRDGKEIIAPTFQGADEFHEGRAFVSTGLGQTRLIDEDGNFLPGTWQYHKGHFARGLGAVSVDENYGYIDRDGTMKIAPQFFEAEAFLGPLAHVMTGQFMTGTENRWITPDGEIAGDVFDYTHGFSDDRAWVYLNSKTSWGLIDERGRFVVACKYYDCRRFAEGLAAVRASANEPWGYIDQNGEVVISPRFDEAHGFADGRAIVKLGSEYRLIDRKGELIGPAFDGFLPTDLTPAGTYTSAFSEGLLGVKVGKKIGFLSKDGDMVIEPKFAEGYDFRDGLALVGVTRKKDGKSATLWGQIDRSGEFAVAPAHEVLLPFSEGLAMFQLGGRSGYIDKTGKVVVPARYKQAQRAFRSGRAWVQIP